LVGSDEEEEAGNAEGDEANDEEEASAKSSTKNPYIEPVLVVEFSSNYKKKVRCLSMTWNFFLNCKIVVSGKITYFRDLYEGIVPLTKHILLLIFFDLCG
jgi:hypothetical protein